jgi:adenylate kinase
MLRDAVKRGTGVGREAEAYMQRGELVPDATIMRLVEKRLDPDRPDAVYLFDGIPRTRAQAELLDTVLARRKAAVSAAFLLEAPRELLIARLAGRRICRACGANYHVVNIPPRRDGVCDRCGGELYQRADDQEATVRNRLDVDARQMEGLLDHYRGRGVLVRVDSARAPEQTVADLLRRLGGAAAP